MRHLIAATAALVLAGPAAAATTPPDLCKGGQISVVRISTLKSPAARAQFDKATRAQAQWYRSHGFKKNRLFFGSVMTQDPATKEWSVSQTEVFSLHTDAPGPATDKKKDAAYDAFVADYRASSDITTEKLVCLREPVK